MDLAEEGRESCHLHLNTDQKNELLKRDNGFTFWILPVKQKGGGSHHRGHDLRIPPNEERDGNESSTNTKSQLNIMAEVESWNSLKSWLTVYTPLNHDGYTHRSHWLLRYLGSKSATRGLNRADDRSCVCTRSIWVWPGFYLGIDSINQINRPLLSTVAIWSHDPLTLEYHDLLEVSLLRIWQFYSLLTRNTISYAKNAQQWPCYEWPVKWVNF